MPDSDPPDLAFDLFVSYAHADDRGADPGKVSALVEAIRADYLRVTERPLRVFFDTEEIRTMDDWEYRILRGLRQSKMMVAVLSPAYFASEYCRKEWEVYVETELAHALPGNGIAPVYVVTHPAFDADPVEERLGHWVRDLRRRQYVEWRSFWPDGAAALERADVRRRLDALPGQIADRLRRADARDASPNTVPLPSSHFVGRRDEMQQLRHGLLDSHIGAITAVHGIPGIGKSMLAFAYAWGYGSEYPGGRYLVQAANLSDLASGVIALAEPRGVALGDAERNRPELALAKVMAAFENGPPALLVVDNLDDPMLLSAQARERALPKGSHIHVLVTTRVSPDDLPRIRCLPLDALDSENALALLRSFRPFADSPQDDEWKAALEVVNRLGGHALAVEVVAVYLRENPGVSYRQFAQTLERDGVTLMDETVGPRARGRLAWHAESCIARLLVPTLTALSPEERRAVEYASLLPADNVPLPWLRALLLADFPTLATARLGDPIDDLLQRLKRLRLVVPHAAERGLTTVPANGPDESRLSRMHRLVQEVVRMHFLGGDSSGREGVVRGFARTRGEWIDNHWGKPGLAWELPTLRDLALHMIDQGDKSGVTLGNQISKPLLHTGRMLEVRKLQRRAEGFLRRLHEDNPGSADDAHALSVCYQWLGDLAAASGDTAEARRYHEDALVIARRLADASPGNAGYARMVLDSYERLRDLAVASGDATGARRHSHEIARRISDASPESAEYARDSSASYARLGDAALVEGDVAWARTLYEQSMWMARRQSEKDPGNAEWAHDLSFRYLQLADLTVASGDAEGARRYFEGNLAITRRLAADYPERADYALDLSTSYERSGDMAIGAGDAEGAQRYYEDCRVIRRRLAESSPENADYARNLTLIDVRMGGVARTADDAAEARRYCEDRLASVRRLAEFFPENADYARALAASYGRLGALADSYLDLGDQAVASGDAAGARRDYQDALAISRGLSKAFPKNTVYARALSISYDRLGDLARMAGEVEEARRSFEDGLAIARRLVEASPKNADYARNLAINYQRLGDLARTAGEVEEARRSFEDGLAIARRLVEASPEEADYARILFYSFERLSDLARTAGDAAGARRYSGSALAIRQRLAEAAPENADDARSVAHSYNNLGDLARAEGETAEARRYHKFALAIRRRLAAAAPENADDARGVAFSYNKLGDLACAEGESAEARRYYESALAIRRRLAEASPENADYAISHWLNCAIMAEILDEMQDTEALDWWRRAWEILSGMKRKGMNLSPEDQRRLENIENRLGGDGIEDGGGER